MFGVNELLIGQISATLTSFSRTIDDYSETTKKELNPAKQEKARERIKNFRAEIADYRQRFESLRKEREETVGTVILLFVFYLTIIRENSKQALIVMSSWVAALITRALLKILMLSAI